MIFGTLCHAFGLFRRCPLFARSRAFLLLGIVALAIVLAACSGGGRASVSTTPSPSTGATPGTSTAPSSPLQPPPTTPSPSGSATSTTPSPAPALAGSGTGLAGRLSLNPWAVGQQAKYETATGQGIVTATYSIVGKESDGWWL